MVTITIRSITQLKSFNKKLKIVSAIFSTLQMKALESAADDTILSDIHSDMKSNNFSQKIIDATFVGPIQILDNGKKVQIHFISNYVDPKTGFDVSKGREEGTASGVTRRPKNPDGALKIPLPAGGFIFRKSSTPKGIERLLIIGKNINKNRQTFKDNYDNEIASTLGKMVRA